MILKGLWGICDSRGKEGGLRGRRGMGDENAVVELQWTVWRRMGASFGYFLSRSYNVSETSVWSGEEGMVAFMSLEGF